MSEKQIYTAAAHAFAGLVRRIPREVWDEPGLGQWDVRALVGHTSRSLTTVSSYVSRPAEKADITSPQDYYVRIKDAAHIADPQAIVERGRQAGKALGVDPAAAVDALVSAALGALEAAADDQPITVIRGLGIRLAHYLTTRIFELTVHSLDIAAATGLDCCLPAASLGESTLLATRIALTLGEAPTVLRALTGRNPLPESFSVVI